MLNFSTLQILGLASFFLALLFAILATVFFIRYNIPLVINYLSGRSAIQQIHQSSRQIKGDTTRSRAIPLMDKNQPVPVRQVTTPLLTSTDLLPHSEPMAATPTTLLPDIKDLTQATYPGTILLQEVTEVHPSEAYATDLLQTPENPDLTLEFQVRRTIMMIHTDQNIHS